MMSVPDGRPPSTTDDGRTRATLACGNCRQRKIKCSGGQPCKRCDELGRTCQYARVTPEENMIARAKKAAQAARRAADSAQAVALTYDAGGGVVGGATSGPTPGPSGPSRASFSRGRGRASSRTPRIRTAPGDSARRGSSVGGDHRESSDPSSASRFPSQDPVPYYAQVQPRTSSSSPPGLTVSTSTVRDWQSSSAMALSPVTLSRPSSTPTWSSAPVVHRPLSSGGAYDQQPSFPPYAPGPPTTAASSVQPNWSFSHVPTSTEPSSTSFAGGLDTTPRPPPGTYHIQQRSTEFYVSPVGTESGMTSSLQFGSEGSDHFDRRPNAYESSTSTTYTPASGAPTATGASAYDHPSYWSGPSSSASSNFTGISPQGASSLSWNPTHVPTPGMPSAPPQSSYYEPYASRGYADMPAGYPESSSTMGGAGGSSLESVSDPRRSSGEAMDSGTAQATTSPYYPRFPQSSYTTLHLDHHRPHPPYRVNLPAGLTSTTTSPNVEPTPTSLSITNTSDRTNVPGVLSNIPRGSGSDAGHGRIPSSYWQGSPPDR